MKIAILGFGTIGSGVYEIIKDCKSPFLENIEVVKILDLPKNKDKLDIITSDINDIMHDETIDCVVETLGGLHPAYEYIMLALQNKKHVVTANKAVTAAYLHEFLHESRKNKVHFLLEASTGGGIPWLASIQKARRIDDINSFYGIFNGTSNFILDYMYQFGKDFNEALKLAQDLGYAEANPSADIDGYDVQNKVVITSALAFDSFVDMEAFPCYSMASINIDDINYLKEKGMAIKYIGEACVLNDEYEAFVMPNIFQISSMEANVRSNYNLATIHGSTIGDLKFYGQGAGKLPTANAIVQDILDINANSIEYNINVDKAIPYNNNLFSNNYLIRSTTVLKNDIIDKVDVFNDIYFYYTKAIPTITLVAFAKEVLRQDANALIAKIANFE